MSKKLSASISKEELEAYKRERAKGRLDHVPRNADLLAELSKEKKKELERSNFFQIGKKKPY